MKATTENTIITILTTQCQSELPRCLREDFILSKTQQFSVYCDYKQIKEANPSNVEAESVQTA